MYLTEKTFYKKVKSLNSKYWNEGAIYRWKYMREVIKIMRSVGAVNTLEMGCSQIPLNSTSYLIDINKLHLVTKRGKLYDLNKTPYPFPDKTFDCAVALQVWEHLDSQFKAFNELCRISKNVILSFPYNWNHGDARHRGIDDDKIALWTGGLWPETTIQIKDRKIYFWRLVK